MGVSQFLVDQLAVARLEKQDGDERALATYHDLCHLKESLGVAMEPRALLHGGRGRRFKGMVETDLCCDSGGCLKLHHHDISVAIGKRDNIMQSECEVVATNCPACMMQISDMPSRAGDRIRIKHVIATLSSLGSFALWRRPQDGKRCREAQGSYPANSKQHSALVVQKEGYAESH